MSAWNGKGGPGGSPEFVHVDTHAGGSATSGSTADNKPNNNRERDPKAKSSSSSQRGRGGTQSSSSSSSSTNWQTTINRLTDHTTPEDQAALRRLGEDVRKAGSNGARAAVDALRIRMLDKNATPEGRIRSIAVARVLSQRASSGTEAQRFIAAPPFVNALRTVASDPNVRNSLKTWASQIRIGDPNDASELAPVTGLDDHLTQAGDSASQTAPRRPPLTTPGTTSFQGRPHLATTEEEPDEDLRQGVRTHVTGSHAPTEPFDAPMPGGFGLDGRTFDANGSVVGAPPSLREFPPSSIQPLPPHLLGPRTGAASGPRSTWGEEEEGVQSDAPSTRSKRTTKSNAAPVQAGFGGATPSMDGGREARDRLNERNTRRGRGRSTRSSSLVDGTLSEPESPVVPAHRAPARGPQPGPILGGPHAFTQRMPPSQMARGRHQPSTDALGIHPARSRSPSPSTTSRSRMTSRSRAQSRRRPAGTDPAAVLVNLAGVEFVRVIEEYDALREDELSLREGDVLAVIRREDGGRYILGHSQGRLGRFPAHVVEVLSHQARGADSAAQEEKTAELLRRSREIDNFMEQLHEFDITRYCITEDNDIQADLASLLTLRNEVVRHLDETTTGIGRLKSMLNKIREVQRVHDRMIDSRIAGYTQRTALHDATPRMNYQELPHNPAFQYAPFDMSQYVRRTTAPAPQQIEQAPARPSITQRTYSDQQRVYTEPAATLRYRHAQDMGYPPRAGQGMVPPRARTYSYTPAAAMGSPMSPGEPSSAYVTEPSTPGEPGLPINQPSVGPVNAPGGIAVNGRFAFPVQQPHEGSPDGERWDERPSVRKSEVENAARPPHARGNSTMGSDASAHTHASRRGPF